MGESAENESYTARRLIAGLVLTVLALGALVVSVPALRISDWYMWPTDTDVTGSWGAESDESAEMGRERITFSGDGTFSAYNGVDCNRISGEWRERPGGDIYVDEKMMTLQSCKVGDQSDLWFTEWSHMRVSARGHQLIVYGEDSEELGRLWRA